MVFGRGSRLGCFGGFVVQIVKCDGEAVQVRHAADLRGGGDAALVLFAEEGEDGEFGVGIVLHFVEAFHEDVAAEFEEFAHRFVDELAAVPAEGGAGVFAGVNDDTVAIDQEDGGIVGLRVGFHRTVGVSRLVTTRGFSTGCAKSRWARRRGSPVWMELGVGRCFARS